MPGAVRLDQIGSSEIYEEAWPEDAVIYQPLRTEQVLFSDWANCLALQAYLNMCNLPYSVEDKENAEDMSPNGKVPFIKAGAFLLCGLDATVPLVKKKGHSLTTHLSAFELADMTSYISMVHNVLGNAELYIGWLDPVIFEKNTLPRYGFVHPWPLNIILTYMKKRTVANRLKVLEWKQKTLADVYEDVKQCCHALSERLGGQRFFFGDKPTELDATVFGHLFTMATTPLPDERLAKAVNEYRNLTEFCQRIEKDYFQSTPCVAGSVSSASSNANGEFDRLDDVAEVPLA